MIAALTSGSAPPDEVGETGRSRWILGALALWVVQTVILLALPPRGAARFIVDCLGWAAIATLVASLTLARARREPAAALGWGLYGIGAATLASVSLVDGILVVIYGRLPLSPPVIALLDNSAWACFCMALLAWTARSRWGASAIRAALDGTMLACSCFLLAWWAGGGRLVLDPDVTPFRAFRSILPFAINATSLGVIAYLVARSTARLRGPLGWLAAGHLGLLLGGVSYGWASMKGIFYPGHPLDAVNQLPLFAFALAPRDRLPVPPPSTEEEDVEAGLGELLTYLPAGAALAVGGIRILLGGRQDGVAEAFSTMIVVLLLGRLFLALRDVRQLSRTLEARVADRTRALEESRMALVQAQRMEAIGRLAGGVAHDFNNLLTAIVGHVELLRNALTPGHPGQVDAAAIARSAQSGRELGRRLLSFAKPVALSPRAVPADEALSRAVQLARGLGRGKVEVETRIAPGAGAAFIDPVLLEQVLTNLAANGIDAMPEGGVLTMEARPTELTAPQTSVGPAAGRYVCFSVTDTGSGMDDATMARIFEPFFTTKADGLGTGLGLPTAYAIVTQAGGAISVRSRPGQGTRFEVLLPEARPNGAG